MAKWICIKEKRSTNIEILFLIACCAKNKTRNIVRHKKTFNRFNLFYFLNTNQIYIILIMKKKIFTATLQSYCLNP